MIDVTVNSLVARAKSRLRRAASNFIDDPEWLKIADVAWRRCYARAAKKFPLYYGASTQIAIVGGTESYALPSDFRTSINVAIRNDGNGTFRSIKPILEVDLDGMSVVASTGTAKIRYIPEPARVTDLGQTLALPGTADEWIVSSMVRMAVTKEGTDRQVYDFDFAELDQELDNYASLDEGWPIEINNTFPVDSYGVSDLPAIVSNLIAGYIIIGKTIEFWQWRAPGF